MSLTHAADLFHEAREKDVKPKQNQGQNKMFPQNNKHSNNGQNSDSNTNNQKFVTKGNNQDTLVICTHCHKRGPLKSKCYFKYVRPPYNHKVGAMSNSN